MALIVVSCTATLAGGSAGDSAAGKAASATAPAAASASAAPTMPSPSPSSTPSPLKPAARTAALSFAASCKNLTKHMTSAITLVGEVLDDPTAVTSSELFEKVGPIDQDRANAPKSLAKAVAPLVSALNHVARTLDSGGSLKGDDVARPASGVVNACEKNAKEVAAAKKAKAAEAKKKIAEAKKKAKERAKADAKREAAEAELENAIGSARDYLSFAAFSRQGLIEQLSSSAGDGYPLKIATRAVDSLHANYNKQATKAAKAYLKLTHFSHQGLVEQLESDAGDGYTHSQAEYGVEHAGL